MSKINPYEPPRVADRRLREDTHQSLVGRRIVRVALLGVVGLAVYYVGVFMFAQIESSVSFADADWRWGGFVAFAFSSSEIFWLEGWGLKGSLVRRLSVSVSLTISSLVIADMLCTLIGVELRQYRAALILPRILCGLPVFAVLATIVYCFVAREISSVK